MSEYLKFNDGTIITAEITRTENLITINNPSSVIPLDTSKIELVTLGTDSLPEHVYGVFEGYSTIYKVLDNDGLILSNDGSVYVEPEPVEPYVPTLAELQTAKKTEMDSACSEAIISGFDVALSTGTQHFDLKLEDQIALILCAQKAAAGENQIEWHPNGDVTYPCVYYSAADMSLITNAAYVHRSYHQTYCNSLKIWIQNCTTEGELNDIYYGATVPVEYQSEVLKTYLLNMQEGLSATSL